jgi:hypothetical protein
MAAGANGHDLDGVPPPGRRSTDRISPPLHLQGQTRDSFRRSNTTLVREVTAPEMHDTLLPTKQPRTAQREYGKIGESGNRFSRYEDLRDKIRADITLPDLERKQE